ncbi:MAG: TIGR03915 family putative DNA repair protein [Bacillota bacterium]|nr:TIGR03915 family putative DNA repair protein [Bacillota bacterium]
MIIFSYDGSFSGLLTAIYAAYYSDTKPQQIVPVGDISTNLFTTPIHISTDELKAEKVLNGIKQKISSQAMRHVYYAFLSETKDASTLIYQYLQLGFRIGKQVDYMLTDNCVHNIHQLYQKVGKERHRLLGLVRFQELEGGVYYATIEPDHNVVTLLAPHFASRLRGQSWIIHDLKRGLAVLFNKQEWIVTLDQLQSELVRSKEEARFQSLWQTFFENISIKERSNPKLQRQFMPRRYWDNLVEKVK